MIPSHPLPNVITFQRSNVLTPLFATHPKNRAPNSFRIRFYAKCTSNPFRIRSYKKHRGVSGPLFPTIFPSSSNVPTSFLPYALQIRQEAADLTAALLALVFQNLQLLAREVSGIVRHIRLRSQFSRRPFCPTEEFDKQTSRPAFKSLRYIGHDRNRRTPHLIPQPKIPSENSVRRNLVHDPCQLPRRLPSLNLLKLLNCAHTLAFVRFFRNVLTFKRSNVSTSFHTLSAMFASMR